MPIVTEQEIEEYTGLNIAANLTLFLTLAIEAAQEYIENYTGRSFEVGDDDEVRYYDGNGASRLTIDDMQEITSIVVDGVTLVENEDYYTFPQNGDYIERIDLIQPETRVNSSSRAMISSPYIFDRKQRNVVITGTFGYSDGAPSLVKMAALKIISGLIKENIGDNDVKEITQETLGEYSVSFVKVKDIANRLEINDMLDQVVKSPLPNSEQGIKAGFIQVS